MFSLVENCIKVLFLFGFENWNFLWKLFFVMLNCFNRVFFNLLKLSVVLGESFVNIFSVFFLSNVLRWVFYVFLFYFCVVVYILNFWMYVLMLFFEFLNGGSFGFFIIWEVFFFFLVIIFGFMWDFLSCSLWLSFSSFSFCWCFFFFINWVCFCLLCFFVVCFFFICSLKLWFFFFCFLILCFLCLFCILVCLFFMNCWRFLFFIFILVFILSSFSIFLIVDMVYWLID